MEIRFDCDGKRIQWNGLIMAVTKKKQKGKIYVLNRLTTLTFRIPNTLIKQTNYPYIPNTKHTHLYPNNDDH